MGYDRVLSWVELTSRIKVASQGYIGTESNSYIYLSGLLSIVGISALLTPTTLHRLAIDIGVVYCHDSVRGRFLRWKSVSKQENR